MTTPSAQRQSLTDAQLLATSEIIQAEVDSLLAANADVNKVIHVSHMQVFDYEVRLADSLNDVDIVIAGGSEPVAADVEDVICAGDRFKTTHDVVSHDDFIAQMPIAHI